MFIKLILQRKGWFYELTDGRKVEVDKNDFSLQMDNEKINFDAVFIGMHGTPGEDGKLQGYFDTLAFLIPVAMPLLLLLLLIKDIQ